MKKVKVYEKNKIPIGMRGVPEAKRKMVNILPSFFYY